MNKWKNTKDGPIKTLLGHDYTSNNWMVLHLMDDLYLSPLYLRDKIDESELSIVQISDYYLDETNYSDELTNEYVTTVNFY